MYYESVTNFGLLIY